jgi:outer membrane receptor for ferrienterochelin and colicin
VLVLAQALPALADVRTEARRHFRRGMQLVADGQVDEGIAELELAYETLPHPNVLYNIGRAYAEAGRYEEALEYFERYLASDPPDREEVEGFVTAINDRLAAQQPQEADGGGEDGGTSETTPEAREVDVSSEEISAIEESATQIETLAEATQSEALRERANRLRQLAQSLRERAAARAELASSQGTDEGTGEGTGETTDEGTEGPSDETHEGLRPDASGEIALGAERTEVFEEEVVSASRFAESPLDAPNSTYIITQQDIRLSGLTNVSQLIRRVAGVSVMELTPGQVDVGIRGLSQRHANKVLFLVDGRSVRLDFLATPLPSFLPWGVEDIERIEVIRGPAAAVYGADAFSGIVNIILERPGTGESYIVGRGGNYQTIRGAASTSARTEALGIRISGGYERAQNHAEVVGRDRVDTSVWEDYDDPQVGLERIFFTGEGRVDFGEGYILRGGTGISTAGRGTIHGVSRQRQIGAENVTFAQSHLTMSTPFGLGLRSYWTRFSTDVNLWDVPEDALDTEGNLDRSDVVDTELSFNRKFDLGIEQNISAGVGHRFKQVEWNWLENPEITEHHFFGYLQDALQLTETLRATLSFRVDRHPRLENLQFSPRGSVVWRFMEGQALRATAGTAFRSPSFVESYLSFANRTSLRGITAYGAGNRNLDPERIFSVELGYANQATDYFALEVNAYYNLVFNQINLSSIDTFRLEDFGPNGPTDNTGANPARYLTDQRAYPVGTLQFNNEPTNFRQYGGEIGARVFPVDGLDFYLNYAFHETQPVDETQLREIDPVRLEDQRTSQHEVNVGAQYRSPFGLDLSVDMHWVSDQVWVVQVTDPVRGVGFQAFPLDGYVLLNARLGLRLMNDKLELGIIGTNLTNQRNRQHPLGQPITTRVMGEVTFRF